jgi:hypothetical protein
MIDSSSVEMLAKTLPDAPATVESALRLRMRRPAEIRRATAALARRGYLACFPLAHVNKKDDLVLRAFPEVALPRTPIATAWSAITEGTTFAPNLSCFVAGRLASLDIANPAKPLSVEVRRDILSFAGQFGGKTSASAVLDAIPSVKKTAKLEFRKGKLWEIACPKEPLCQVLAGAWTHQGEKIGPWLEQLASAARATDIARRLFVTYHVRYQTGVNVTADAWKLIESDNLFDPTYIGLLFGPAKGTTLNDALSFAVRSLEQQGFRPKPRQAILWQAALHREEKLDYDGRDHLQAAQEYSKRDPELAFRQAVNAAAFFARTTQRPPKEAIKFAHLLAKREGWTAVEILLGWARHELGF